MCKCIQLTNGLGSDQIDADLVNRVGKFTSNLKMAAINAE